VVSIVMLTDGLGIRYPNDYGFIKFFHEANF
jgi:hypothetical protein